MEYEEVSLIKQSERCTVHLVYEKCEGHFFIWKVLTGEQRIYQILQDCSHPCLPKLYDVIISDGVTTVIEEYIEGQSLGVVRISIKQFRSIVKDLCSVLEYLHGMGIIHRDIKPSNIIFAADEHVRLLDFDAARMPKDDLEQDTRLLGTRGYAPPEQYGFSQTDARTDIYALGVTLNQIMEGQIHKRRYKRVIKKCMNLNPDKRYQTVRQMRRAFFPAKRNASCIIVMLMLAILFWNDIKTMSKGVMERTVQSVSNESDTNSAEILFDDSPVYGYLGRPIEDIMEENGDPDLYDSSGGTTSICLYPGIEFHFDGIRGVYNMIVDTSGCTYNGQRLKMDRAGLIAILDNPSNEGWVSIYGKGYNSYSRIFDYDEEDNYDRHGNVYYMEYKDFDKDIDIEFYFTSPDKQAYAIIIG